MPNVPRNENGSATSFVDTRGAVTRSVSGVASSMNRNDATNTLNNHDDDDTRMTVDDVTTEQTIKLGIDAAYTDWSACDAFRELVRHWHSSILTRHCLSEPELLVHAFESPKEDGASFEAVFVATATVANDDSNGNCNGNGNNTNGCDNPGDGDKSKKCLGYIRYKSTTKNDNGQFIDGTVDVASRKNRLQPWHFGLGASPPLPQSDKDVGDADVLLYGRLPLAFVALMRSQHNHNIVCTSGGLLWTGNHSSKGRAVVHLRRLTEANKPCTRSEHRMMTSQALPQVEEGGPQTLFGPDIDTDLHIRIGDTRKVHCADRFCARNPAPSYDEAGQPVTRCGVTLADFRQWTKTALCLWRDTPHSAKIVPTPVGDLLLVPALQGLLYEDGFLLPETKTSTSWPLSVTGSKTLHYGYNFKTKDKKNGSFVLHPHSTDNGPKQIIAIWEAVLQQRPDLTHELHSLLVKDTWRIGTEYRYPEGVAHGLYGFFGSPADAWAIKLNAGQTLARLLWQHLRQRSMAAGAAHIRPRGGLWYYSGSEAIAKQGLPALISAQGRRGVMLDDNYWSLLKLHCNIYRFSEMEQQELAWAPVVAIGTRSYSQPPQMMLLSEPNEKETNGVRPAAVSPFQTNLIRLLHATFLGTYLTRRYGFVFVKPAANIDLDITFDNVRDMFCINARWLDLDQAAFKLGLAPAANNTATGATGGASASSCACEETPKQCRTILHIADRERTVLLHATKTLFAWALDRLPHRSLHGCASSARQADIDRPLMYRQVINRAEKRILDNLDLQGPGRKFFVCSQEQPRPVLHWTPAVHPNRATDMIVQCHRASCTVRSYSAKILRSSVAQPISSETTVLLARDLNPDNMPCLRAATGTAAKKTDTNKPFCCVSKRLTAGTNGVVLENPTPGDSYIFVAVHNPDDEYAIARSVDSYTFPRPTATTGKETISAPAPTAPIPNVSQTASVTGRTTDQANVAGTPASTGTQPSMQRSISPNTTMADASGDGTEAGSAGSRKRRRTGDGDVSAEANKVSSDPGRIGQAEYQLQLKLLEQQQQNYRRLQMARQEQDMLATAAGAVSTPH